MTQFDPMLIARLRREVDALSGQTAGTTEEAMVLLLAASGSYRDSFPIVDRNKRRSRPSISEARSGMANLTKRLAAADDAVEALNLTAKIALGATTDSSIGHFRHRLESLKVAATAAQELLAAQPDKQKDNDRIVLARNVALVFRDVLGVKPAATRDTAYQVTGKRGGAGYARVLRATLELAGWPNTDLGPVIDGGLDLLNDPELP